MRCDRVLQHLAAAGIDTKLQNHLSRSSRLDYFDRPDVGFRASRAEPNRIVALRGRLIDSMGARQCRFANPYPSSSWMASRAAVHPPLLAVRCLIRKGIPTTRQDTISSLPPAPHHRRASCGTIG
jgi:hypothetical protein